MQEELWGKQMLDHVLARGVGGRGLINTKTHALTRPRGKRANAGVFSLPTDERVALV